MKPAPPDIPHRIHRPPQPGENTPAAIASRNHAADHRSGQNIDAAQRLLKISLTETEFQALKWTAAHAGPNGEAVALTDYCKGQFLEGLRKVVVAEIVRGKTIPENLRTLIPK